MRGLTNAPATHEHLEVVNLLQWRAGHKPGLTTTAMGPIAFQPTVLQWRAGQMPGLTSITSMRRWSRGPTFNGGLGTSRPDVRSWP